MLMLLAVSALSWAYDYEVNADMVISEVYPDLPVKFSTIYDCDGDGEMDYLCYKKVSGSKSVFGFYNKKGELLRELPNNSGSSSTLPVATPINGSGDLVNYYYNYGDNRVEGENVELSNVRMIADVDNDGRMDFVQAPDSKSFIIYYQQADGTFLPVTQNVTGDAAEAEAAAKRKGTGGVVSFAVGMMVKAREIVPNPDEDEANARSAVSENVPVGATSVSSSYRSLDMNDDGINDIFTASGGSVWYSYDDNKWFFNSKKGGLYPCDLNGDSELDYICYDGSAITLQTRISGSTFEEKSLFTNSKVKQIYYKDFDHDGDIDIMAYIIDGSTTYFVFFRNDGDMSFKRRERNFAVAYTLHDIRDIDADGQYEMLVSEGYTLKMLRIDSNLSVTEDETDMSDSRVESSCPVAMGDFNNDGRMECRYYSTAIGYPKFINLSEKANSAPKKMKTPAAVLNPETQRLLINWNLGEDTETSACDLTYELRIGTQPGSCDVLFGASLADGRRRTLDEGNMGRSLSTLFNAKSMKPGKYYISVQAIDGGGRGGAWSDDFVYEHQLTAPVIVSNFTQLMTAGDTLLLKVKAPVEGAEYQWTVSNGRQIESDGGETCFVFEHDGKQTVNLAMTYDGRTLNAEPLELEVTPAKYVSYKYPGFVDFNQDGYPEYLGYVNDGKGNLEKVMLSYATQHYGRSSWILDFNMDGYPDVLYSSNKVLINLGEQDNDFDVTTESVNLKNVDYAKNVDYGTLWFDANNDGYLDTPEGYNNGTNTAWSKYTSTDSKYAMRDNWESSSQSYILGSPNYDVNRDGMLDIVRANTYNDNKRWYVMYKDSTANISYTSPQLMFEKNECTDYWFIEDINDDGYVDIIIYKYAKELTIVKGCAKLPYTETVVYDFPLVIDVDDVNIHDYNNDGYLDVFCVGVSGSYNKKYLIKFGPDFSMEFIELYNWSYYNGYDYFMVQKDQGYPCSKYLFESHIKNQPPSAPATVAAKQTKDGLLITWSDAEDDHTPAMQMRYNISVKRKGKKGDNSFVISPMNGLKDEATICGTIMYKKSTQMLVPSSVLKAGETYEIQVQAIDLWNQHSPMTKAIEFTMTTNGYIDVAEKVAVGRETSVKYVGASASNYNLNAGTDGTVVSDKGNGSYVVKWTSAGKKDLVLTVDGKNIKSSVTVVNPIDLTFTVPAKVFAGVPLVVNVSDEMAAEPRDVGMRIVDNSKVKVDYVAGSKTATVTFPTTGNYVLEAYSDDAVKGNSYRQTIRPTAVMPKPVITQVDVDSETGYYAISWNSSSLPDGISQVAVMKEGSILGEFSEIALVNANAGRYVDKSSTPSVTASRYCIQLVAESGQKSELSNAHRPLHVMVVKGTQGFNLIWDDYEGLNVASYNILRGTSPNNLQQIAQVAGSINSYSDVSAPSGVSYYAITFKAASSQNVRSGLLYAGNESVGSNVISTENAVDVVPAQSIEIIVLDEDNNLSDEHRDLQLYHMILPTYTTVGKVVWEITEGSELATINSNGKLHAIGGKGTVVAEVRTIDGSDLSTQISISVDATKETGIYELESESETNAATLIGVRYYTLDGHRIESPIDGRVCVEWSIYSNGRIVSRKIMK